MGGDSRTLYVLLTANAASYRAAMRGAGDDTDKFGRKVDAAGRSLDGSTESTRRFGDELNNTSGRVGLIVDALALMGPALIPLTAGAIPAVTALSAGLAAAAVGGGAVILAAQGMGDAFKALTDYGLDPTADNLAKVEATLDQLAPAAAEFTLEAWRMRDAAGAIQDAAAQGFFPGATEGLLELEELLPTIQGLMYEAADVAGDLAAEGAEAFNSEKGRDFLRFLEAELRPAMTAMFDITANLAGAASEGWQAFDVLNDDFLAGMVRGTEKLEQSAARLKSSEGFAGFVDYIQTEGPEALETLAALGDAGVQLVQAMAPLGGPALDGIEFVAEAIATIADSPLGTPLLAGFAALTLLNRSMMVTAGLMTKIGLTGPGGAKVAGNVGGVMGAITHQSGRASTNVKALSTDVKGMRSEYARLNPVLATTRSYLSQTTGAAQRTQAALRGSARAAAGGGAALAGLTVLSTEYGQSLGMNNTAMLGMAGMMVGRWGGAVGAGIGYMMDFAKAGDEVGQTIDRVDKALNSSTASFDSYASSLQSGLEETGTYLDRTQDRMDGFWSTIGTGFTPAGLKQNLDVLFNGDNSALGKAIKAEAEYVEQTEKMEMAGAALAKRMGVVDSSISNSNVTLDQMNQALQLSQPAMQALGISVDDLVNGISDGSFVGLVADIEEYQRNADSAQGRTENFAGAVQGLGNDAISTADSAAQLNAAIAALLGPEINAEAATDAWRASLSELRSELNNTAGFQGYSEAAMKNREATRDYVNTAVERLTALAEKSETTEHDMAIAVGETREEFIKSGVAAGFSRKQMERRADSMKLTPKMVKTVFEAVGLTPTALKARDLRNAYKRIPGKVRTDIAANGIPKTSGDVDRLVAKYRLTEKQRTALITLKDQAKGKLRDILEEMIKLDGKKATPQVLAATQGARNDLDALMAYLNNIDGKTATTYVRTVRTTTNGGGAEGKGPQSAHANGAIRQFADGGGIGLGGYYDRVPQIVPGGANILWGEPETGWEAYISGKPSMRHRNAGVLKAAAQRLGYSVQPREGTGGATGGGRTVVVQGQVPDKMTLVVDGRSFTAYVRSHAGDVARSTMDTASHAQAATERMNWRKN